MNPKKIGDFGERIACQYLEEKGYKVLGRNYIKKWSAVKKGEIDIIVKKDDIISFVEVKTIRQDFNQLKREGFLPEAKVNSLKRKKLINLAQFWLLENKISLESKWQVDIIAIRVDLNIKKAKIKHFQNIIY